MKKTLILAEKPSVGRDIAKVLECKSEKNGYIEGDKYIVTWALGHLVTLAETESYDNKYKNWDINDLPILPKTLKTVVIKKTSKQFNTVKSQINRDDVQELVIATDAGREGELVARWIIDKVNTKKPLKRLWISSSTDKAIKEGFKNLRDSKDYDNLYYSAVARAEADWIIGINATRALTTKHNAQLSCGRVQTPTLAIINKKEEDIRSFVPKKYYNIEIDIEKASSRLTLLWEDKKGNKSIFDEEKANKIKEKIKDEELKIIDYKEVEKKKYSPALYDLTELQRDANRIYGYSPKETLSIMQKLYETHKVLTYPRTDSRYISSDIVETLKDRIKAVNSSEYSRICTKLLKTNIKANKSFVDDSKVSDHHAIIPTEERVFLNNLSDKERKIYDIVVKRFLAVLSPVYTYNEATIIGEVSGEIFTTKMQKTNNLGWKEIYNNTDEIYSNNLIKLQSNENIRINKIKVKEGSTNPPSLLNEATLLTEMEKNSLGTVATRADIIEKLYKSFLIENKKNKLTVTSKGKQLLELAPIDLKTPELTSDWEEKLNSISKGKTNKKQFVEEIKEYSKAIVKEIKQSDMKFKHDNLTKNKCPECSSYMLEVNGKKGKMLVCENRECNTRKTISQTTNSRCPVCHKKLELRGEGENKTFVCSCGHREKLSSFNKRKKEEKNKASKKDINKYLKNQKNEQENFNNPFAEALLKLKK